jgi:hypothetical protein
MIDAALERHLVEAKEMQACWKQFKDFFLTALRGEGVSPANEQAFLRIKSRIAMLHDPYLDMVKGDRKIAQNIIQLVGRSITLKHVSKLSLAESKKFEIEWHEAYLQIEETIGFLETDSARLASITASQYRTNILRQRIRRTIQLTLHSAIFKLAVVAVILLGIMVGMTAFNVGDKLYANPSTRGLAVLLFSITRLINPDQAYYSMAEENVTKASLPGNKPASFTGIIKLGEKDSNIKAAAALATWNQGGKSFSATADLEKAKEFCAQQITLSRNYINIYYFRFEKTKEAQELMDRLGAFNESLGKLKRTDPAPNASFFRSANIVYLIISENNADREWIRRNLFNVKLDTDS